MPVVARSNASKARYVALLEAISIQSESSAGQVCFAWQRGPKQHCSVTDSQQAVCDEISFTGDTGKILLAQAGRSPTRPNTMVLGQSATPEVIRHEWAHWLVLRMNMRCACLIPVILYGALCATGQYRGH